MNATEKQLIEKLKELYQHALRIPRSLGEWDPGMMIWKDKRYKLESELNDLESEDELRERKTSNTGRGHGNNFCPENCD